MNDAGKGWLYKLLFACTLGHMVAIGVMIALPTGELLPPLWAVPHVAAMVFMAGFHCVHHLGAKQAVAFFLVIVLIEGISEQINIAFGGIFFGDLIYHDTLAGPKIGDVPIIVPFAVAALMWPPFVMVNIMLHERAVVIAEKGEGILRFIWRCAILAFVHTAWAFGIEPVTIKMGVYQYVGLDASSPGTFYGVPMSEFRGWWVMAFVMFFVYSKFVAPRIEMPKERPVNIWIDATPYVLYGGFALFLILDPMNPAIGVVTLWTMGLYIAMSAYKLSAAARSSSARLGAA
jgi:uncharacterized membrane protein